MDIDEMDLVELFQMIDTDGSGTIEASEFIKPLSRWVHEPRQAHDVIFFCGFVSHMRRLLEPRRSWSEALPQLRTRKQRRDSLSAVVLRWNLCCRVPASQEHAVEVWRRHTVEAFGFTSLVVAFGHAWHVPIAPGTSLRDHSNSTVFMIK